MNRTLLYAIVIAAGLFLAVAVPLALKGGAVPSTEDAAQRIAPVANFELQGATAVDAAASDVAAADVAASDESAATPAATESVAVPESPAVPAVKDGASVYASLCFTCHDYGVAGAPKKGDKAAWASRLAAGEEALYATALNGKGLMQPKGGNPALSDAEVKSAVDYLIASVR
ncbi:MAG: c-type cytochrome [Zoogloeaceae bacterium]|jgi:cytochrome c5|nr:c-type cytochrome [Zoogloeaceae bacterium]